MASTDTDKLRDKIKTVEEKKFRLLELYMSKNVTHDELTVARTKCDNEIAELEGLIESIEKQETLIKKQGELISNIRNGTFPIKI